MKPLSQFEKIYIESSALETETAQRACHIFPKKKIHIVDSFSFQKGALSPHKIEQSKKILLLKNFKGSFFKRCPGTRPKLLCCNYYVLNLGQNCEMDCSYCYLQSFINLPAVVIYTNIEDALKELKQIKKTHLNQYIRIGTGEQTDSLSLDDISLYSQKLIAFFRDCPHWQLEFKTKSHNIKNFENLEHRGNVTVSWSINPEEIVSREEHGTSSLDERLFAAKRVMEKDFPVSFHIDPMIYHPEWELHYGKMIQKITEQFPPEKVNHISIGALRFPQNQRAIMRKRFTMESLVCNGEFFKGRDGKLRYDSSLRQEMFQFVFQSFKKHSLKWNIFLCMETPENWLNAMNATPMKIPALKRDFNLKVTQTL